MPGYGSIDVGVEPPIDVLGRRPLVQDRRAVSLRWLSAVVLTGVAGSGLIGTTIYAALNGRVEPRPGARTRLRRPGVPRPAKPTS